MHPSYIFDKKNVQSKLSNPSKVSEVVRTGKLTVKHDFSDFTDKWLIHTGWDYK